MRRHCLTALLLALVFSLCVPGAAFARAEVVGGAGLGCCVDLGVRLSISLEGSSIRGAVVFPRLKTGVGEAGSGVTEILGFSIDTVDVVLAGVPIVRALAGAAVSSFGMRVAREARI